MLKWFSGSESKAEGKEDLPVFDQARVAELDLAIVFKHSTTCPVSFSADRQMRAFMASHPEVPVYKVLVREGNALRLLQPAVLKDIAEGRVSPPRRSIPRRDACARSRLHRRPTPN